MARIEHFAVFGEDLELLRIFYVETMGLRVLVDNSRAAVPGYFLGDDAGNALEIIARPAGTPPADTRYVCHTAFLVDDFAAERDHLARSGAQFEPDTEINQDDFRTAFFRDPAGNRCQIVWGARPLGS
jgi:glyoxylase I family protein